MAAIDINPGKTHLTVMNAVTTMSERGQVVIPKDVRDRLKFLTGDRLEVVERPDGVFLRKPFDRSGESFEAITARIRSRVPDDLPVTTLGEMDDAIRQMWEEGGPRWDT